METVSVFGTRKKSATKPDNEQKEEEQEEIMIRCDSTLSPMMKAELDGHQCASEPKHWLSREAGRKSRTCRSRSFLLQMTFSQTPAMIWTVIIFH
nr:uncharacterized protein LOC129163703 isoform X2 [Nothobranchius furzeri]